MSAPASVVPSPLSPESLPYFSLPSPGSTGRPAFVRWSTRHTLRINRMNVRISYQHLGLFVLHMVVNPLFTVLNLTQQ